MVRPRIVAALACVLLGQPAAADERQRYVVGDAIPQLLTAAAGDVARGRAIVVDRRKGFCLLCHSGPFPEERFQGDLAPSLDGAGDRLDPARLRLRIVDSRRVNPDTIMPSYYETSGRERVGREFADKPILDAQEIEDVVAFLTTLKDPGSAPQ